jgi:hypothetical protein
MIGLLILAREMVRGAHATPLRLGPMTPSSSRVSFPQRSFWRGTEVGSRKSPHLNPLPRGEAESRGQAQGGK